MTTTSFVDNSTLIQASWLNDADTIVYGGLTSIAGTNTVTATGPASMTAYAARQLFWLIPANTNTGATTLNITPSGASALGAKAVQIGGVACAGGELLANFPALVEYDGTQFQIISGLFNRCRFAATPNLVTEANTIDDYLEDSFVGTLTGCTTAPTGTIYMSKIGNIVIFDISTSFSGTSNATTKTITGQVTARLRPATAKNFPISVQDNGGSYVMGTGTWGTNGVITLYPNAQTGTNWTASGTFASLPMSGAFTIN